MARTDLNNTEPRFTVLIMDHYDKLGGKPPEPQDPDMHVTELHAPNIGPDGYPILQYHATGTLPQLQRYATDWGNDLIERILAITDPATFEQQQDQLYAELQMGLQLYYATQPFTQRHPFTVWQEAFAQFGDDGRH